MVVLTGLLCGHTVYTVPCKAVSQKESVVDKLQGDVRETRDLAKDLIYFLTFHFEILDKCSCASISCWFAEYLNIITL